MKTNFVSLMIFIIVFLLFLDCYSLDNLNILLNNAILCMFLLINFNLEFILDFFLQRNLDITSFLMYYHYDDNLLILLNILYFKYVNFQPKTNIWYFNFGS